MVEIRISEEHVWVRVEDDGTVLMGVTEYALHELGEITYIELPEVGQDVNMGEEFTSLEADDGTLELNAPITGTVSETNDLIADEPTVVSDSPLDDGWMVRLEIDETELEVLDELLDEDAYQEFLLDLD